jgi:hypothetical protein
LTVRKIVPASAESHCCQFDSQALAGSKLTGMLLRTEYRLDAFLRFQIRFEARDTIAKKKKAANYGNYDNHGEPPF